MSCFSLAYRITELNKQAAVVPLSWVPSFQESDFVKPITIAFVQIGMGDLCTCLARRKKHTGIILTSVQDTNGSLELSSCTQSGLSKSLAFEYSNALKEP